MARNLAKAASNAGHSSERLRLGQQVIETEASALVEMARNLGPTFLEAVDLLLAIQGRLIVTGIGKAGLIGAKLAATFSSTGTPSHFLHPSEAIHGDLGVCNRRISSWFFPIAVRPARLLDFFRAFGNRRVD